MHFDVYELNPLKINVMTDTIQISIFLYISYNYLSIFVGHNHSKAKFVCLFPRKNSL